jgi:ABC-2 type transport system permease protein
MKAFLALLRRHLGESKWVLGTAALAFFGLSVLTVWITLRFEALIDRGELGPNVARRGRVLVALGGPAMDYSTTALEICWWNHPLIVLTVLGWAITRGASAGAGEIERGTLDLTLSRPVSRTVYLTSHVAFTILGLLILVLFLWLGNVVGSLIYPVKSPPSFLTMARPMTMLVTLGMAVFGYTIPFSSFDVVRWRAILVASALTLGGLISMSIASQFEGYEWLLEKLSVFRAYAPVTVAMKGEPLAFNAGVLTAIFALGVAASFAVFLRRDLPSNS